MRHYQNIVILTGAGVSAESGLGTFRGEGGLWENHRVEDVATPEAFARDPDLVYRFYNMRRAAHKTVKPNPAHIALARLEDAFPGQVTLVTQNVDALHEAAGSKHVLHMHGELMKARCNACGDVVVHHDDLDETNACEHCSVTGRMRPHIVWFGEMPFFMDEIYAALADADLFISIGTSGNVYPAAGFVAECRNMGHAHTVELNLEPSEGVSLFHEARHGPAGTLVPEFIEELLNRS